jgi:DNA mismatch repair protein MutS
LYVAKLAGIPPDVVERAKTLLAGFEEEKEAAQSADQAQIGDSSFPCTASSTTQNGQQAGQAVLDRLAHVDPLRTTPIDALLLVSELKQLAEGSEEE